MERQVRETVWIQQRGSVLNKRGEFHRCKLTRIDVDVTWEKKCWDQAGLREETWRGMRRQTWPAEPRRTGGEWKRERAWRGGRERRAQLYGERVCVQRTRGIPTCRSSKPFMSEIISLNTASIISAYYWW
jgi:hypothetical protein